MEREQPLTTESCQRKKRKEHLNIWPCCSKS